MAFVYWNKNFFSVHFFLGKTSAGGMYPVLENLQSRKMLNLNLGCAYRTLDIIINDI
jgi:hypothetical protein